ncbi:MAG: hypothetical protein ACTTJ7_07895 [Treponema sp.]
MKNGAELKSAAQVDDIGAALKGAIYAEKGNITVAANGTTAASGEFVLFTVEKPETTTPATALKGDLSKVLKDGEVLYLTKRGD